MDDLVNHGSWDLRKINTHSTKVPLNSHRLVPRDKCPLLWCLQSLSHKIKFGFECVNSFYSVKMVLIRLSWFIKVISTRSFSYWWLKNWEFWFPAAAAAGKSLQLCPTLCDHIDGSPPGPPPPRPWDSPGKNTGVGCISFSKHESEKWKWSRSVVSDS